MSPHPADHPGPLAFVDDLEAPVLSGDDRHHLTRVLRLRPDAPCTIADGAGRWRTARLGDELTPTGPVEEAQPRLPRLAVGVALVKGDKPELVVQKLTELGIDRIVLFRAARSVVRWDDAKGGRSLDRLRQIARAAAMQCHRPDLPVLDLAADLAALAAGEGLAIAQRDGPPITLDHPTVLVGPEGGWSDEELGVGLPRVGLGEHVLRAETAAITAGVLLSSLRGAASR